MFRIRNKRVVGLRFPHALAGCLCLLATSGQGQSVSNLPSYKPGKEVHGVIRVWGHGALGHDYMNSLIEAWEIGFREVQPGVTFDNELHGTASAMGALYTGVGDIAVMGREIWPMEVEAYEEVLHSPPFGIDILTGSVATRNKEFALVAFANAANPIQHLSLEQLARVLGGRNTVHRWGELGLKGDWVDKPIHVYGFEIHRGFGYYMQQRILDGSSIWNPDLVELGDVKKTDGHLLDAGQRIVDAIGSDPYGIGYSSLLYKNSAAKALALGPAGGPFLLPSKDSVEDHTYPLYSKITCFIRKAPGKPADPKLAEFLRYILSGEGHATAEVTGGYIPLTPKLAASERNKLK